MYDENKEYNISSLEFDEICRFKRHLGQYVTITKNLMGCLYFETRNKNGLYQGLPLEELQFHVAPAIHILIKHYGKRKVYSETPHRHARIALLRAGFKKIMYNIYKWEA